jgi:carboxylesterase
VLVHGFTATPEEMRSVGEALAVAGFPCRAIRLPGHATTPADLARARGADWIDAVEAGVAALATTVSRVAIAGLSLGALLALEVAARGRVRVDALALCATPLLVADERTSWIRWLAWVPPFARPRTLVRKRRGRDILDVEARARSHAYDAMPLAAVAELLAIRARVRRRLATVTQPTLVLHGRQDRTAPVGNVAYLQRHLRARPLEAEIFEASAHVLTEDQERAAVADRIVRFLDALAATPTR